MCPQPGPFIKDDQKWYRHSNMIQRRQVNTLCSPCWHNEQIRVPTPGNQFPEFQTWKIRWNKECLLRQQDTLQWPISLALSLCFYAQLLHELGIWLSPPSTPNQTEDIRLQKARGKQDALKVQWCREAVKQIRSNHILHKQAARHNCPRKTAPSFSLSVYIFHVWVSGSRIPLVICASCAGKMLEERSKS